jgi:SAM-dependent methyltransferase
MSAAATESVDQNAGRRWMRRPWHRQLGPNAGTLQDELPRHSVHLRSNSIRRPRRRLFDAAIAWGVIFHLPHDEQRRAIAKIASVLKPGGLFLFTGGDEDGDKEGDPMNGVPFHYWSFSIDRYRELLRANGLTLVDVHHDAGQNTYYLSSNDG